MNKKIFPLAALVAFSTLKTLPPTAYESWKVGEDLLN
jgi:hypothetical protein